MAATSRSLSRGTKTAQTRKSAGELLAATPRRIELHTANDIRREMAKLYRDARTDQIATQDATRLAYILDLLRKAFEADELERRVHAMEAALMMKGDRQ